MIDTTALQALSKENIYSKAQQKQSSLRTAKK